METRVDTIEHGLSLDVWEDEGGNTARPAGRIVSPPGQRARGSVPFFVNDRGVKEIAIGVTAFNCMGTSPPGDHPHVYLNMGIGSEIICPYCATLFCHDLRLGTHHTEPLGCLYSVGSGSRGCGNDWG